jgi:hypothetical protein
MTSGWISLARSKPASSEIIGVLVAPPGTKALTVTPVLSRSFAMIALSASSAALEGVRRVGEPAFNIGAEAGGDVDDPAPAVAHRSLLSSRVPKRTLEQLFEGRLLRNPENLLKLPQMGAGMSPQDCRDRAEACEGPADAVGPSDRIRTFMRRLADDSEAHERRLPQLSWARAAP